MKLKLILPVEAIVPRKTKAGRKFLMNLNNYRNADRFFLNDAKIVYEGMVERMLRKAETEGMRFDKCYVLFIHHPKNDNIDTANVLSIVEKFAFDAIQDKKEKIDGKRVVCEERLMMDDSRREIKGHHYHPGKVDKEMPHVEMFLFDNKKDFLEKIYSCYDSDCKESPNYEEQSSIVFS